MAFHGKFMQALNDVLNGGIFANSSVEKQNHNEKYDSGGEGGSENQMILTPFFTPD